MLSFLAIQGGKNYTRLAWRRFDESLQLVQQGHEQQEVAPLLAVVSSSCTLSLICRVWMATNEAARQHLQSATLRALRAHEFSKTSSNAVSVLVDLVSRFLDLLAASTAEHAQFAGRTSANLHDALEAFEELGIDVGEVLEWRRRDAPALSQYASTMPEPTLAGSLYFKSS